MQYRADIDGLRAIAVLLVVFFHFKLVGAAKSGFVGVDIFFVISGFLITSIIVKDIETGRFSLKEFYIKRIRRLAPALFVTLALVVIAGWLWLFPVEFKKLIFQVFASQFYFSNIHYWLNINYFGLVAQDVYLLHTWSLSVEEQFYLIYPIMLLGILKFYKKYAVKLIILGIVISFYLNVNFVDTKPEATFYLLPTRGWEFLIGALIYFAQLDRQYREIARNSIGIVGFFLVLLAILIINEETKFPGFFALLPVLGGVCLLIAGGYRGDYTNKVLSLSPLVYIGKISYPLYLVHWPVNIFARFHLEENYTYGWRFLALVFSMLLSALIFHLVENPIRKNHFFTSGRRIAWNYCLTLATTVVIFLIVDKTGGVPSRFPVAANQLESYLNDYSAKGQKCKYDGSAVFHKDRLCKIGVHGKEPEWLIYGDSHALAAYGAFDLWMKLIGQTGEFVFLHSCPPVKEVFIVERKGNSKCKNFNDDVFKYLQTDNSPRNVFLVSTWTYGREGTVSTYKDVKLSAKDSTLLFVEKLNDAIEKTSLMGKKVYVWEPVPGAKSNVPIALAKSYLRGEPPKIKFSKEEYMANNADILVALEKSRQYISGFVSPAKALCESGECAIEINGIPIYTDNSHISYSSSPFWAQTLINQIK